MKTLYTAVATATDGGRDGGHTRTDDGKVDFDLVLPQGLGGPGGAGTNPEQLFAAGYAGCFASALKWVAMRAQRPEDAEGATVTVEVDLGVIGSGRLGLAVRLRVVVPKLAQEEADALVAKAHRACPYSNAIDGNVEVTVEVEPGA